jgi:polysaccharide biosynthesis/export protein ExoF
MKTRIRRICAFWSVTLVLSAFNHTARAADYIVRPDDKLKVRIFQYPELSGEYTVDENGKIVIPEIGDIPVNGLSTNEVTNQITERIVQAGLSNKPGTSVEVLQSQPVYVLGDVQKPGEYAFHPGISVLQVVSLAGGWLRFNDPGLVSIENNVIAAQGELRKLTRQRFQIIARRARLNAEIAMNPAVKFPDEIVRQAEKDVALSQLLDEERSLLNIDIESTKKEFESIDQTRYLYQQEIEAVSLQITANQSQYDSVEQELGSLKPLSKEGLVTASRLMDLKRLQAQIEMNGQGFQTLILRAREAITQLDQRKFDLQSKQHENLMSELEQTRIDLDGIAIRIDTNQKLLVEARLATPDLVADSEGLADTRNLTIIRVEKGKTQSIEANENTELLPGDVLKVRQATSPDAQDAQQRSSDDVDSALNDMRSPVNGVDLGEREAIVQIPRYDRTHASSVVRLQ